MGSKQLRQTGIDYVAQSEMYRPVVIQTLLIGEAPPPNGTSYFYLPAPLNGSRDISSYRNLPATIFHHYFRTVPVTEKEYEDLLLRLKNAGVFLIDILDVPVKVRNSPIGLAQVIDAIPLLRAKLKRRRIEVADEKMVFLLARTSYRKHLRQAFPRSAMVPWIDFRMTCAKASSRP